MSAEEFVGMDVRDHDIDRVERVASHAQFTPDDASIIQLATSLHIASATNQEIVDFLAICLTTRVGLGTARSRGVEELDLKIVQCKMVLKRRNIDPNDFAGVVENKVPTNWSESQMVEDEALAPEMILDDDEEGMSDDDVVVSFDQGRNDLIARVERAAALSRQMK